MPLIQKRSLVYNKNLKIKSQNLRNNQTKAEKKLWFEFLRKQKAQFYRQKPIYHYIVDFYCPQFKLVIEVDGDSHFKPDAVIYDKERTQTLSGLGLREIRFTNSEVLGDFEAVCNKISRYLS